MIVALYSRESRFMCFARVVVREAVPLRIASGGKPFELVDTIGRVAAIYREES